MDKIIEVTQKPIIEYSIIESASIAVDDRINSLSLETLEVSENSLSSVKNIRAELNNEFKIFEEQRKMVKDIILKPYNEFEEQYKNLISSKFKDADILLKNKIDVVTDEILNKKVEGIKEYFESVNEFDFIRFEDLNLKIIKSVSDKKLFEEINAYLENITNGLSTIETLPNKDRVMAKFQMSKDLNWSISQTNIEIQREEEIEKQRLARIEAEKQRQQQLKQQEEHQVKVEANNELNPFDEVVESQPIQEQVYKTTFTVIGTKNQLKALKEFMKQNNIQIEGK